MEGMRRDEKNITGCETVLDVVDGDVVIIFKDKDDLGRRVVVRSIAFQLIVVPDAQMCFRYIVNPLKCPDDIPAVKGPYWLPVFFRYAVLIRFHILYPS